MLPSQLTLTTAAEVPDKEEILDTIEATLFSSEQVNWDFMISSPSDVTLYALIERAFLGPYCS
jgi:hypothetical protein